MELTTFEIAGAWVSIFLTICILSFLYDDNPIYKLAEHIFLGVSIAIGVIEAWNGVFKPNLVDRLYQAVNATQMSIRYDVPFVDPILKHWLAIFPAMLIVMLFFKLSRSMDWVARIPIAFIVATFAGTNLTGEAKGNLMAPMEKSMPDLATAWHEHGFFDLSADGAGLFSALVLVFGICATLIHFYFSAAHNRPMRVVSRFAVIVLMLSFGASFGYTVMGRISLAIGRAQALMGLDRPLPEVAQIHPQVVTVVSLVLVATGILVSRLGADKSADKA